MQSLEREEVGSGRALGLGRLWVSAVGAHLQDALLPRMPCNHWVHILQHLISVSQKHSQRGLYGAPRKHLDLYPRLAHG